MVSRLTRIWRRLTGRTAVDDRGARGETAAAEFLKNRHGFSLVTRNWRHGRDEIDLVARDGEVLVFVEVKARAEHALVPGYFAVDDRKKRALRRAVHAYLSALAHPPRTFRFDVVEVALRDGLPPQCLHFANIPLFPKGYHVARQSGSLAEVARSAAARGN